MCIRICSSWARSIFTSFTSPVALVADVDVFVAVVVAAVVPVVVPVVPAVVLGDPRVPSARFTISAIASR